MDNSGKIVLDLCGGTGAWSRPYKEAGYNVLVITLPDYDVLNVEFNCDEITFISKRNIYAVHNLHIPAGIIYGILAAPPCMEFSIAKGNRPRNLPEAMRIVEACERIIRHCQLYGNLKFWALENPRGLLRRFLGVPKYTFEQWQFGGNKRKATDLWGYFNQPTPPVKEFPSDIVKNDNRGRAHAADWTIMYCPPEYADYISQFKGDAKRAALRALTLPGFAEAFYKANR